MKDDPLEFVNYSIDVCSKHISKTFKSQAAKLLEHIVDHTDGMLTFCVSLTIDLMNTILTG